MRYSFNWKRGFFSDTYKIYSNNQQIGTLRNRTLSQNAVGNINERSYTFKTKGFFKQHTKVYDNSDNSLVGEIAYGNWMTKAYLSLNEKEFLWKYKNAWNTRWTIYESDKAVINYKGSYSGHAESDRNDDLLLLTGLYVTKYYWQMTLVVLVAVLIPIFASS